MAEKQTVATQVDLTASNSKSMEPTNHDYPMCQASGTMVNLNEKPQPAFQGFKGGDFQVTGEVVGLNKTAQPGFSGVPMSDRNKESKSK